MTTAPVKPNDDGPSPGQSRPRTGGSVRLPRLPARDRRPAPDPKPWRVEGERPGGGTGGGARPGWSQGRRFWTFLLVLLLVNWLVSTLLLQPAARTEVPYTVFRAQVTAGNVPSVTAQDNTITGDFRTAVRYPATGKDAEDVTHFRTHRPDFADDGLFQLLQDKGVVVTAEPPPSPSLLERVLLGFGPTLLLVGLFLLVARRAAAGGAAGIGGFGKSRAKTYEPESGGRTSFADVAGIDEVEDDVKEIVDFLRTPERYTRLGAVMPKGILLSGPPGTGKTLLARAVAGEAGVPFFIASASEFIEMIVGVGASRVRDLFEQAKKSAPAIIFIDELDAIGRARGGAASLGGNDEREQTLNQILTEMDGFTGRENVVVIAATNRSEILDPALLRPGRFDRRLTINPPDADGRRMILEVHARKVPLDPAVDLGALAATTPGMVGAELANLINEAALTAARRGHDTVTQADLGDALERLVLGTERRIVQTDDDKRRTAHHECGHALVGMLTPGADPVRKISIVPRGHALGVTFQAADVERYAYSEDYLKGRIAGMMGGRAAEQLMHGEITTGAENDLEQATAIARQMAGRWGMSGAVGPVSVLPGPGREQPFGGDPATSPAPGTRERVDAEVRRILEECYAMAFQLLTRERGRLERLAEALIRAETLDAAQAYEAAGVPRTAPSGAAQGPPGVVA